MDHNVDVRIEPRHFCHGHLGFLEDDWPHGYVTFAARAWQAFVDDPRVVKETGGKVEALQGAADRHAPICCFLGESVTSFITEEAKNVRAQTKRSHRG